MEESMKSKAIAVVGVVLVLALALVAWTNGQADSQESRLITVSGNADVRIVPDEVIVTLGVETWDKDLEVAKGRNDAIVKKVLALVTDHGIPPEHVQTDYIGIEPRYRDGYYEQSDFIGYFVHKNVVITLRDLSQFEGLLSSALKAGVNYVQGIEFRTTELRKHRDEARALAVRAAQEKASAMAKELGQRVGKPQTVREEQSSWWSGYGAWWGARWGGAMAQNTVQEVNGTPLNVDGSVAPGQISVTASVTVSFELTD